MIVKIIKILHSLLVIFIRLIRTSFPAKLRPHLFFWHVVLVIFEIVIEIIFFHFIKYLLCDPETIPTSQRCKYTNPKVRNRFFY